jgi:pimeloyl-ACP methyl ester carboxylesterase
MNQSPSVRKRFCLPLLLLVACADSRQDDAANELALAACEIAGEDTALCGTLRVPENWNKQSGRMLDLNVVILPANGTATEPPLVDLAGGPGLAATGGAAWYIADGAAWRRNRDIILFDQRGTGNSAPAHCPEVGDAATLSPMYPLELVRGCVRKLSATHDLSQYSSVSAVRDIEAIRDAIDAEEIDLFGMSYGTRLAQAYIRAYPQRVRAAAFIGAVSMDGKSPLSHARNAESTLQAIFDDCGRDTRCAGAFPDLRSKWKSLQDLLRQSKLVADTGNERKVIEPGPFMEAFRTLLIVPSGQRTVPVLITELSSGDTKRFLDMIDGSGPSALAEGAYLSIECTESTDRIDAMEIDAASANTFLGRYRVDEQLSACSVWPGTDVPESFFEAVVSDVPLLLLAGGRDHTVPAEDANSIAKGFRNSRLVIVEEMGHVPDAISNLECLDRIMLDFFAAPLPSLASLASLETGCVHDMRAPPFELPTDMD